MARKRKYNEIYDLMDSEVDAVLEQTVRELNSHFKNYGVEITSMAVTNVHLPREFAKNMEEATVWHDRNEYNTLEQKYKLRRIETSEAEAKDKQRCKEDLEKFIADKDAEVAGVNKKRQLVLAVTNKMVCLFSFVLFYIYPIFILILYKNKNKNEKTKNKKQQF